MLVMVDREIEACIQGELERQSCNIELIASENFASPAVLRAQGSILTNKYAEGYPGKRYYEGCTFVDRAEQLAIDRAKALFDAKYVNVQPHSGSQANQAALLALLNPGDTILAMSLDCGGHLSHGAKVSLSGKWFNSVFYGVNPESGIVNYDEVEALALKHKPKLIIAGYSSYPREVDFARFRGIADKVGAYLLADIAHIAGIIAAKYHQNPLPYAHVVTSSTHKTLRGPRGGFIMTNMPELHKKIDSAVFPGVQGGPLMHVIAAKAVAFGEALDSSFKLYIKEVLNNAKVLSAVLLARGHHVLTGGTDNHMLIVALTSITGKEASDSLSQANIACNKNAIPFDSRPPALASGIRLGSPACTTRGMGACEFKIIGNAIADILDAFATDRANDVILDSRAKMMDLCKRFPLPYS
jgi:glycine hydroxymethyltransferase